VRRGATITPFEAKYSGMKKIEIQRSFRGFIDRYKPNRGYIINLIHTESAMLDNTEVFCLPFWELLFEQI